MRILTFSSLYPNARQPLHGVFVENRLRHLVASGEVTARVLAPVPWFPFAGERFGAYGVYAEVPRHEQRHGLHVDHPRYPVIPKIGMSVAPLLMFQAMLPVVRRMRAAGDDFDLIDAHYFYPDGVAATLLARALGKPVTITARGNDISLLPDYRVPRAWIQRAAARADALITVCQALKNALVALGVDAGRITVLRNGVDLRVFRPVDREAARARFKVTPPVIASVGHLIPRKGHDLVIRALALLPTATLLIVGTGPEELALRQLARDLGVGERTWFLGSIPHAELTWLYAASDALVLASSREGWANVLLEAMASGTPAIASNVWGAPEVITAPEAGLLLPERTPGAIAAAVTALLRSPPDPARTRAFAERFGWEETTQGQLRLFRAILARSPTASVALSPS